MSERSGAVYCNVCKKCICKPRIRKYFQPTSYITCDECDEDVFEMIFVPNEEAITTNFKIKYRDLPALVRELNLVIKAQKIGEFIHR